MLKESAKKIESLTVTLILPSRYDDEGYIVRYLKGVLPSNTIACMRALTLEIAERWKVEKGLNFSVEIYDEVVDRIPFKHLASLNKGSNKVIAALVGVQSNQFPRASDIAKKMTSLGIKTVIGGFHISGIIALFGEPSPEIKELMDIGVTMVHGEAENQWENILSDIVEGCELPLYRFSELPDISQKPMPRPDIKYIRKYAKAHMGTLDCSRGCPFNCSFCSVINVQGHKMRYRCAENVLQTIRENYAYGINQYFLTDDNFSRNPEWEKIFDGMAGMAEKENIRVSFTMQVDMQSSSIRNFTDKAFRAGCTMVFIGMESLNPENLAIVNKKHNNVDDYASIIQDWHNSGITTHVGYIIGFPFDTPESVREDIRKLIWEIKVDHATFFMLIPLPGSKDHFRMTNEGAFMDPDLNGYDSFHAVMEHPRMSKNEWLGAYNEAWEEFYGFENMKNILLRADKKSYWGEFKNIMWYKNSLLEPRHPMVAGFIRRKKRTDIRPGKPLESRWSFTMRRIRELTVGLLKRARLFGELNELWLLTRRPNDPVFRFVADFTSFLAETKTRIGVIKHEKEVDEIIASVKEKISFYVNAPYLKRKTRLRIDTLIDNLCLYLEKVKTSGFFESERNNFTLYLNKAIRQAEDFSVKQIARRRKITSFWTITIQRINRGEFMKFILSSPHIALNIIIELWMDIKFVYFLKNRSF